MMSAKELERFPVLVTDPERSWLRRGIEHMIGLVQKQKKGLDELDLDQRSCIDALTVLEGNGVNGGLLVRFANRAERDLFGATEPTGLLRELRDVKPDEDPLTAAVVATIEAAQWKPSDLLEERLREASVTGSPTYFEDSRGDVFKLVASVAVALEHVGRRKKAEVDAAVQASDKAAGKGKKGPKKVEDGKGAPAGNVDALEALPWGSDAARELAHVEGLTVEQLAGKGTGSGNRITKRDVQAIIADLNG